MRGYKHAICGGVDFGIAATSLLAADKGEHQDWAGMTSWQFMQPLNLAMPDKSEMAYAAYEMAF